MGWTTCGHILLFWSEHCGQPIPNSFLQPATSLQRRMQRQRAGAFAMVEQTIAEKRMVANVVSQQPSNVKGTGTHFWGINDPHNLCYAIAAVKLLYHCCLLVHWRPEEDGTSAFLRHMKQQLSTKANDPINAAEVEAWTVVAGYEHKMQQDSGDALLRMADI